MNGEIKNDQTQAKINRVLDELRELAGQGLVKKEDVFYLFEREETQEVKRSPAAHLTFQQVLYFVGAFIIILGVGILVAQAWAAWGQIVKVVFALGLAALLYGVGYYIHYSYPRLRIFSGVSFILSVLLFPLGIGTFLDLVNISAIGREGLILGSVLLFIIYFSSYWTLKNDIFLLFSIWAGSGFFLSFVNLFVRDPSQTLSQYLILVLGASYLAFGYYYQSSKNYIVNFLYLFGLFMFLGATFSLSLGSLLWLLIFPFLLVATFYASVTLQSKLILVIGTLFTFIEIGRLTSEYFSRTFGWPLALIIAGFGIIFVGYISFEVSKRYLKKSVVRQTESARS